MGFKIISWNCNGLRQRINELRQFVIDNPIDIILVQEVKTLYTANLKIQNYTFYHTPRIDNGIASNYGGTIIYVHNRIPHSQINSLPLTKFENTIIKLNLNSDNFIISSVYLRHSTTGNIDSELDGLLALGGRTILFGDFNAHHPSWNLSNHNNTNGTAIFDYCTNNSIDITAPSSPTHYSPAGSASIIDFAILNNINYSHSISTLNELSSDHLPVLLTLDFNPNLPALASPFIIDWNCYIKSLLDSPPPFENLDSNTHIDLAAQSITHTIKQALEQSKFYHNRPNYDAIPKPILDKIKHRNQIRRLWQLTRDPITRTQMNKLSAEIKKSLNNFKNKRWSEFISSLSPSDNSLWNFTKKIKKPYTPIPSLKSSTGLIEDDDSKIELIATQYENQFTPHEDVFNPTIIDKVHNTIDNFSFPNCADITNPTTPDEISKIINNQPNRKSPGIDGITNNALKNLPLIYAKHISDLANAILKFGHFPTVWKKAVIIPIPKPGEDLSLPKNYRPISLLSSLSKIIEQVILTRIRPLIPVAPHQFGFRPRHSTTHQVLRVVEFIHDGFENKESTGALFLDIAKAFDTVWHSGLIYKLIKNKVPPIFIKLINSYLRNRSFSVKYHGKLSTTKAINAGVPQGSKIGPWLFNFFINDIPTTSKSIIATYADDTAILASSRNNRYLHKFLQKHIDILEDYFADWRIKINPAKSTAVFFSNKRIPPPPLDLNGISIHFQREAKYLGFILDSKLTWNKHISFAIQKFSMAKRVISHLLYNNNLNLANKILLYKTVLAPILLYGSSVWGSAANTHIQKLQVTQSKTIRGMTKTPWYVRNTCIHKDLNILPLRQNIKKQAQKFYDNIYTIDNELLFTLPDYDVRNNPRRPRAVLNIPEGILYR